MNKVFLIGNLTKEPELTETNSGVSVCKFSIAVNRPYTGSDGERKTDFFNCIAWRGVAETITKYIHKGNKVGVIGSIEMRQYTDNNGNSRQSTDIVVGDVEFLTKKESTADNNAQPSTSSKSLLQPLDDDCDIPF